MQSLVIVIILLSLIGLYINLGTVTDLSTPEFNKKIEDMSADKIADKILEEIEKKSDFDSMGNSLKTGDGLDQGDKLVNLSVQKFNTPNTRPYAWTNTVKKDLNKYGVSNSKLSYRNNFPYDVNYLADVEAKDTLRSKADFMAKNGKSQAFRSQIVLPEDPSKFKESYKFMDRATAIIRNQIANENKTLTDLHKVETSVISERGAKTIHRVDPDHIEVKPKPVLDTVKIAADHSKVHSKLKKPDLKEHAVNTMKREYNFK